MRATPGGRLPIDEIYGRDSFIVRLWSTLERGSVRLEAERRIGKTHILAKMAGQPPPGWEVISVDLEKVHSAGEFAERIGEAVDSRLEGWTRRGHRLRAFVGRLGGAEVGPLRFPDMASRPEGYWKTLLVASSEDLVEQQEAAGRRVVILLDEMPWMLANIAGRSPGGERTAMEVLDVLRGLRQSDSTGLGFRMVLCGSIGLHHVLGSLRRRGYGNQPVNDMVLVEVPPLEFPVATELTGKLLTGEGLEAEPGVAALIAEECGGFPYYIHWIVSRLRTEGRPATAPEVEVAVRWMLTAPHDPCSFRHFKERLAGYYPGDDRVAIALLDHAASLLDPLAPADFVNVANAVESRAPDQVRELLRLLAVDHYLERDGDGRYRCRHALLRRWWRIEQGIA